MTAPRKVFTEAMIRRVLKKHFEIEELDYIGNEPISSGAVICNCGQHGRSTDWFDDHIIDQLHKLWHEMFSRKPKTETERLTA